MDTLQKGKEADGFGKTLRNLIHRVFMVLWTSVWREHGAESCLSSSNEGSGSDLYDNDTMTTPLYDSSH
ncbi:hypothetical protein N3930_47475, partial [Bacillus thuringiensis]|nr:hypothetical protein [Bacillus thuringiensis]